MTGADIVLFAVVACAPFVFAAVGIWWTLK